MLAKKAVLRGFSEVYGVVSGAARYIQTRSAVADRRAQGCRVISVGNLRMGGSGKTPLVAMIATRFRDAGHPVAILLRGYRGRMEATGGIVSLGDGPLVSAGDAGDEAYMLAQKLGQVIVAVGVDRHAGAQAVMAQGARVIILDDGFQYVGLSRDLDLVMVCPDDLDPSTTLFPAGPLREPARSARRADLLVGLEQDWRHREDRPPVIVKHVPTGLLRGENPVRCGAPAIAGKRVHLLCGIGMPNRFARTVQDLGATVTGTTFLGDHRAITRGIIRNAQSLARAGHAQMVLMTCKDLARLNGQLPPGDFGALEIECQVVAGDRQLSTALGLE